MKIAIIHCCIEAQNPCPLRCTWITSIPISQIIHGIFQTFLDCPQCRHCKLTLMTIKITSRCSTESLWTSIVVVFPLLLYQGVPIESKKNDFQGHSIHCYQSYQQLACKHVNLCTTLGNRTMVYFDYIEVHQFFFSFFVFGSRCLDL